MTISSRPSSDLVTEIKEAIGGHSGRVADVASYLGIHPDVVRDLCWRGEIPFWQSRPGTTSPIRIRAAALAKWIETQEAAPTLVLPDKSERPRRNRNGRRCR